jgi:hypothetical protein
MRTRAMSATMPAVFAVDVVNIMRRCRDWVSNPIKDPLPLREPRPRPLLKWPVARHFICSPLVPACSASFIEILELRRSVRKLAAAPLREIVNVLAWALRPRFFKLGDPLDRTRRPSVSAGALHPIEFILITRGLFPRTFRYDARRHRLEALVISDRGAIASLWAKSNVILPGASGTLLVAVGDLALVSAAYENPISLIWRDAGAALQTLAFVSAAFRLGFCPLGILGNELLQGIGVRERRLIVAGVSMIGRPAFQEPGKPIIEVEN